MKLKTLIKTLIVSHVRRAVRSISAAKSKTLQLISDPIISKKHKRTIHNNNKVLHKRKNNKIFFGSFRFHYNWCSSKRHSHVLPVPAPVFDGLPSNDGPPSYYDSTWHSIIIPATSGRHNNNYYNVEVEDYYNNSVIGHHESQLYGYLQWLEEKRVQDKAYGVDAVVKTDQPCVVEDNIDKLADLFIANCHAKFILEKQESARRFNEMLERSA